ncbi:cytosine permease [Pseudaminobacter sp. 19-2017]|uniref:Cytosine permease n=1 Tax=Pseudaminobacter soli (ex Zhang et al. 2022) TaxID=2831468 RepID=A0A942E206_9HYPH|nr:cytosine permease [Pseudaminobacter soli]MBS3651658.1 cytosine permease [Pseudaminobacter soli]
MKGGISGDVIDQSVESWPVPLAQRTWGGWHAGAVSLTAGVATWSFVVGGFAANYVDARAGTAAMLAGGLISQFLVSLAQIPAVTKYGLETVSTTKPQLGTRGSAFALFIQYLTLIGWNCVLIIFLGRAVSSTLLQLGLITGDMHGSVAIVASVLATFSIWVLLLLGAEGLKYTGVIVAAGIFIIGTWMYVLLFQTYGLAAIVEAKPLAPLPQGRLMNYTIAMEVLLVSSIGWWAYMGSMFRLVNKAGRAVYPSMGSLGFGWAAIGLIGLYSGLIVGQPDPAIWIVEVAGPVAGVGVLLFVIMANLGSAVVASHAAALGVGQVPILNKLLSWPLKTFLVLLPMFIVDIFFPSAFYDNIGTFMAFIGIFIAPLVGVQIVDWFAFRRIDTLHVPSLFRHDQRSCYWYKGGINPPGIVALVLGALTYIALLDPVSFVPNLEMVQYTTATLPSALVGAVVYYLGMRLFGDINPEAKRAR